MNAFKKITAVSAVALLSITAIAAEEGATAPTIEVTASRTGNVVTVSGSATAGSNLGAESVGGFVTEFADATVASQAGIQLTDATIAQDADGLTFAWHVENLHSQPPPEVVRYNFGFAIDGATFQLQAKTSNVGASTAADDPAGHVTHVGGTFQVRGNCTTDWNGTGVSSCPHIGWVDGAFDSANNQITMTVPYGFHEAIQPGAVIVEHATAGTSIVAGFQAVLSTADTGTSINNWSGAYSADLAVFTKPGFADDDPTKMKGGKQVELNADGTFTAEAEVEADEVLWVLACSGFTCTATMAA